MLIVSFSLRLLSSAISPGRYLPIASVRIDKWCFSLFRSKVCSPETAFTLEGEFFEQTSVDDGVLFGLHKANAFTGMEKLDGFHFHDLEKNATPERLHGYKLAYNNHLKEVFAPYHEIQTHMI